MGAYLAKPKTEKFSESNKNEKICYGVSCMQGWRVTMEDAHNCMLDFEDSATLFGVYDGHGGSEVAQYVAKHLPDVLKNTESFKRGEVKQSLVDAFLEVDNCIISNEGLEELRQLAGTDKDMDEEEDLGMLEQEALMPLQDLLARMKEMKKARNEEFEDEDEEFEEQWTGKNKPVLAASREKNGKGQESGEAKSEALQNPGEEKNIKENGADKEAASCEPGNSVKEKSEEDKKEVAAEEKKVEEEAPRKEDGEPSSGKEVNDIGISSDACDDKDENSEDDEEGEEDDDEDDDDDDDDDDEDDENDDGDNGEQFQTSDEVGYDSGTTAIVALLHDNQLTVANVGDSRCVLCRNGIALEMSVDHKPEDQQELDRIHKAGGKVTCEGRVNGGLNLSRALGDHSYKLQTELSAHEQQITAVPDVRQTQITEADEFMVIACDGIWNMKGSQEVVDFVSDRLTKQHKTNEVNLEQICEELIDSCMAPDTSGDGSGCDNMTCIIVLFNSESSAADLSNKKRKSQEDTTQECDSTEKRPRTDDDL